MKLSLIIPAYNEEKYIGTCLEFVHKNAPNKFFEIIVVDNASTDNTKKIAEKFPGVRVVFEPQKGLTKARQRGLEEAQGDLLAYIDADTQMPPGWVDQVEKEFSKHQGMVSLSGPYKYYDATFIQRSMMSVFWWLTAPITYRVVGYMVLGGNFIAKTEALRAMGGFDTSISFYGEDTDIARRLSPFGKVVFKMNFFIYSSIRRLEHEGLIRTNIVYALNFFWQVIFKRPFTKKYKDIRETTHVQS